MSGAKSRARYSGSIVFPRGTDETGGHDEAIPTLPGLTKPPYAAIKSMNHGNLKNRIPDSVITQIPVCAKDFGINTRLRLAHFLSQCDHESAGFKSTVENLNYSSDGLKKTFPKYFPGDLAKRYARHPEKIAARVYANRMGNGDEASQDGWIYRGRGFIQLTGKLGYQEFDRVVDDDILATPDLVASKYPLLSAAWYWQSRGLNELSDQGIGIETVTAITVKINGGMIGLQDRIKHFKEYYAALA